jgi:hypothetical protein
MCSDRTFSALQPVSSIHINVTAVIELFQCINNLPTGTSTYNSKRDKIDVGMND